MGKAEAGTPKALANKMKSKGLQKLKFFCQMCAKQCRDENGFKCHLTSESHAQLMNLFAENPDRFLNEYSTDFVSDFVKLLSRRFGTRRILANQVYNEYISDRNHLHMNSTIWETLTHFIKYLGKEGIAEVDETEKGWYIRWIDRRPETLARQESSLKKERMERDDESVEFKLLETQILKAQKEKSFDSAPPPSISIQEQETLNKMKELTRNPESGQEPLKLTLEVKKSGFLKPTIKSFGSGGGIKKFNPLKVGSSGSSSSTSILKTKVKSSIIFSSSTLMTSQGSSFSTHSNTLSPPIPSKKKMTAMEEIIREELLKKQQRIR